MTTLLDDFGFRLWGNMAQHIVPGQEELLILYYTCICIYTVYCIPYTVIQSYTVTVFRIPNSVYTSLQTGSRPTAVPGILLHSTVPNS